MMSIKNQLFFITAINTLMFDGREEIPINVKDGDVIFNLMASSTKIKIFVDTSLAMMPICETIDGISLNINVFKNGELQFVGEYCLPNLTFEDIQGMDKMARFEYLTAKELGSYHFIETPVLELKRSHEIDADEKLPIAMFKTSLIDLEVKKDIESYYTLLKANLAMVGFQEDKNSSIFALKKRLDD